MAPTFACGACNRSFAWKPPLAGKRVKCKCGQVIDVPAEPLVVVEVEQDQEPAPQRPAAPVRKPPARPDALLASLGRAPQRVSHLTEEMLAEDRARNANLHQPSALRDRIVPVILIVVGLGLSFYELTSATKTPVTSFAAAAPKVLLRALSSAGLMLLAVSLAVQLMDIALVGSFSRSILKLIGIAIGPMAVYSICTFTFGDTSGPALGALISIAAFWILFFALMRLDMKDTTVLVVLTWIVVTLANYISYKIEGLKSDSWI